jgi:hypothetical protein
MATFSLIHSADMIHRVMNEVKIREDEYDLVKTVSSQIRGLQQSKKLARRERRLLIKGDVLHASDASSVYLFVFTDVILVARPIKDGDDLLWSLDELSGVCRLLEVVYEKATGRFVLFLLLHLLNTPSRRVYLLSHPHVIG